MIRSESKIAPTEFEPPRPGLIETDGVGHPGATNDQREDLEDDVILRGVVAIEIPREVIARFSGTLIVTELPERQPEIVFDRGRQFRGDDDE